MRGPRPETTGQIASRILDPRDEFTPGPREFERLARGFRRLYLWPIALALALSGTIAGGAIWLYRVQQGLGRLERLVEVVAGQGGELKRLAWQHYRLCVAAGLGSCPQPGAER